MGMGYVRTVEKVNFHVCFDGNGVHRISKKGEFPRLF